MLPPLFAAAADRAMTAGFDGVELHFAHAYTMASFLSALNTRGDGYGGSREHRVRLPREVVAAVREVVAGRGVVGCRYLGDDVVDGGNRIDDAAWFGVELARAGLDFLSITQGRQVRGRQAAQGRLGGLSVHRPQRLRVHADDLQRRARAVRAQRRARRGRCARAVRAAGLTTPVVAAGGICDVRPGRSRRSRAATPTSSRRRGRSSPTPTGS